MAHEVPEFGFTCEEARHTAAYLRSPIMSLLPGDMKGKRVLDVGCGNGYWCGQFLSMGATVVGVDASEQGIAVARKAHPGGRFENILIQDDPLGVLQEQAFDVVVSTEVVEHLYDPRQWARSCFAALRPGGALICTTPYHGYLKNVALAVTGKMESHFTALWDGGHIKFWSRETLSTLLKEAGFRDIQFRGAGRAPYLWMSMVLRGTRPS